MSAGTNYISILFFFLFVGATLVITYWAARRTKTAEHFYAAGRSVTGFQNGLALAGDYMSAASFLGIAGLVALHVAAIAFYLARKEDLLTPMLTGDKLGIDAPAADDSVSVRVRAAVLAALAGGVIYYLVTL